ncbi:hypothetical protein S7335_3732 [Synechococcus sp. PCC 7335]|nr:hypothetical protein S7335_3732 [Synechococcus sp. PCC 7335]
MLRAGRTNSLFVSRFLVVAFCQCFSTVADGFRQFPKYISSYAT